MTALAESVAPGTWTFDFTSRPYARQAPASMSTP
jgi:hypothetical protein